MPSAKEGTGTVAASFITSATKLRQSRDSTAVRRFFDQPRSFELTGASSMGSDDVSVSAPFWVR